MGARPRKLTPIRRRRDDGARRETLTPCDPQAVMQTAFALAKELSLDAREEQLIGTFGAALRALLPGRCFLVRIVEPRTLALTALVAEGPLLDGAEAAPLALKRSALLRTRVSLEVSSKKRLRVVDAYHPVFRGTEGGFAVPLVASGEIFGMLNVEYPPGENLAADDEPYVIPLANQLSVALRNQSLLGETRYYRDYLRHVIDVAPALIIVIDRDERIAVMNAAMQKYLGWGPDVIGKPFSMVRNRGPEAPEPRLGTLMLGGLQGEEYSDVEMAIVKRDGTMGRAVFNTSVLRAADGIIDAVIGIGQDRERVRALERQVIQAEKLATLGQLAAGVVHELNNPLSSISVYADYLKTRLEEEGSREDLEKARKIIDGAARIQKLTRDLMSYARPAGEFESVVLNDVVRQAVVFCEHLVDRADAMIVLQLEEGLPRIRGIRSQLHQVVINLLTNACHALPAPGQRVTISTARSADGRELRLEVGDTGVGVDEADRARIFEPFFTTKKEGKGTGLGLSIVKNIVEGHGGRVTFESRVGEGTTFQICLPTEPASSQIDGE